MCWCSLVIGSAVRSSTRLQRPPGTTDEPLHSLHLIASAQCDQFSGDCLLNAAEHSPEIRPKNEASTNEIRFVLHLVDASQDFPQGVTTCLAVTPCAASREYPSGGRFRSFDGADTLSR